MKTNFLSRALWISMIAGAFFMTSCDTAPKGDAAEVTGALETASGGDVKASIDLASSNVVFVGNGVGKNHPGTFALKSGEIQLKNNEIVGGNFVIDVKSLDMKQSDSFIDEKLLPHLLSADFFDAEKFPEATFEITSCEPYTPAEGESVVAGANFKVSGNLKLRDQVKNITFPAHIVNQNGAISADAKFDIDRTEWGMQYGNDESLKDKFISPTVNIQLTLAAKG